MSFLGNFDFDLLVSMGLVNGISKVNKFGRNIDIDTGTTPEDIWDGGSTWTPPTAARIHDIASSSANDAGTVVSSGTATGGSTTTLIDTGATFVTDGVAAGDTVIDDTTMEHATVVTIDSETQITTVATRHRTAFTSGDSYRVVTPASTGATVLHIYGLDSSMLEQEEFIVLNGTSNVATVNTYYRIYRMHTDGAASRDDTNIGNLTATAQTDGTVTAQVNAGNGQTLMAIYTIPSNKTAFITQLKGSINRNGAATGAMADLVLYEIPFASVDGAGRRLEEYFSLAIEGTSFATIKFKPYKKIDSNTDLIVQCEGVTDNNTDISAGFDLYLVDNDLVPTG